MRQSYPMAEFRQGGFVGDLATGVRKSGAHERARTMRMISPMSTRADKVMRLHTRSAMIENGFGHLPTAASWLAAYLHEITTFPMAGTTTRWIRRRRCSIGSSRPAVVTTNAGIFEYAPQLAEKARTAQPRREPLSVMARRLGILCSL